MTQVKSSPVVDRVAFEKLRRVAPSALAARRARQVVRPLPDEISFKLTNRCNLRCHHCYEWSEDGYHRTFEAEERNRDLDISVVVKLLDATRESGANVFLWVVSRCFIPTGTTSSSCSLSIDAGRRCAPTASTSKSASSRY